MFPRNLTLFRFPVTLDIEGLEELLADRALKSVGPLELASQGFVPPLGHAGAAMHHRVTVSINGDVQEAIWITVGTERRMLPAAVVNDQLQKKLAAIEEAEGRKPGGRTRKRIKEELVMELLPRAFVRAGRTDAILLPGLGVIAVDTASRGAAEAVVSELRLALGSFPALPVNAEVAPRALLTGWLAGDALTDDLYLGDSCELRDPSDRGKVRITDMDLLGEEVERHLEAGKQCTRLALTLGDRLDFEIGEDLVVRKFKLLDGAVDALETTDREDIASELLARFALAAGEVTRLFGVLEETFRLSRAEE